MVMDIWVISVMCLAVTMIIRDGNVDFELIIKSIFPTTFATNWYMTCYILFYVLHPLLNMIIKRLDQKGLLTVSIVLSILYLGFGYISGSFFFSSIIIVWIANYFVIAYAKKYLYKIINSKKANAAFIAIGIVGICVMVLITNYLGQRIPFLEEQLIHWVSNSSPFVLLLAFGLFNIFRNIEFTNASINYASKLSMLIYIIHENLLLRTYYRPMIWHQIYVMYGYDHIIALVFIVAICIFVFGLIMSIIYKSTIQRLSTIVADKLYIKISNIYGKFEERLINIQ